MNRLTTKNETGINIFKVSYQCEDCDSPIWRLGDLGNGSPTDKLAYYEDLEEKLKNFYGVCDNLLEVVVNVLIGEADKNNMKAIKTRLLTGEDADKWESYKKLEEQGKLVVLPCKIGDIVYVKSGEEIIKCKVTKMRINPNGNAGYTCHLDTPNGTRYDYVGNFTNNSIGKTVFLTKEGIKL